MSKIEIRYFTGDIEERTLSKTQPLSVGRQASNDVCIDEDDVGPIHCRIAWGRDGYEVSGALPEGVELNNTLVKTALLSTGDVIRVGTVDLTLEIDEAPVSAVDLGGTQKPLPDDLFEPDEEEADEELLDPDEVFEPGEEPDAYEPSAEEEIEPYSQNESSAADTSDKKQSLRDRLRHSLDARSVRPGEQDVIRSKFIIGLGVGSLVLLLISAILWFWTQRNASERLYESAKAKHDEGKYAQAIEIYSEFLQKYPRTELATTVHFARGYAKIDRHLSGAASDWESALKEVENFIKEHRDREGFSEQRPKILDYAQRIAKGAAQSAQKRRVRSFLPIAKSAQGRAKQYEASQEFLAEFEVLYRTAEAAVVKEETFQNAVAKMKQAIDAGDTMSSLQHRLDLLQRYQTFDRKNTRILAESLRNTLEKEKSLVVRTELNRPAATSDRPERLRRPLSLTYHVRPQDGRTSDKTNLVIALAKQCCYGVDSITGEPVWRRAIGEGTPFFPLSLETSMSSLLAFDTEFSELVLLNRQTGKLLWRQPLRTADDDGEFLSGSPVVHDGFIYAATLSNCLYKLDLDSGRAISRLTFSQPINATPVLSSDRSKLILAGHKALLYTVKLSPKIACESATYLGHRAGSIVAPLRSIGKLLLVCENDKADSARLRVLNSTPQGVWLQELTPTEPSEQVRVKGVVLDMPVLRNNKLFVTSSGERVTVFSVSDEENQAEAARDAGQYLRKLSDFEEESQYEGPIYLVAGPNGQFWMATDRLRKFQFKPRSIQPDTEETAAGRASQPPQAAGPYFYLGRESARSTAIIFTRTNREVMKGEWSLTLGASILAWSAEPGKPIVCVNENGQVFRVERNEPSQGGFKLQINTQTVAENAQGPFQIYPLGNGNQGISVKVGDESKFWVVNSQAQIIKDIFVDSEVQAEPAILPNGIVVPLSGRLKFIGLKPGTPRIADYEMTVTGDNPPRWTFLVELNGQVIAADERGGLVRVQLRNSGGRQSLSKAVSRQLQSPVAQGMTVLDGKLIMVDGTHTLHHLSSSSLQPTTSLKLSEDVSNALWAVNNRLYVETAGKRLHCFRLTGNGFKREWQTSLTGESGLAGAPQTVDGKLFIAEREGTLHWLDPQTGQSQKTFSLGEGINHIPKKMAGGYLVPSIDGSLHWIPEPVKVNAGGQ